MMRGHADGTRGTGRAAALALVALAALGGCKPKQAVVEEAPVARIRVDMVEVVEQPMPRSLSLTGTLRGQRQTEVAANATGRVLETFIERGTEVKKGDLLARLDVRTASLLAAEAQAHTALARAQQDMAKRECDRYRSLLDRQAISQSEYDRIADQCQSSPLSVAAAEARARAAAQVVGDGAIRAPFGGIVLERFIEVGEYVRPDTRVVALAENDPLRIEFTVPEANLTAVKPGGALTFTVPAYPGRTFPGTVRLVGAAVREATRDLVAEAEVQNSDRALRPGMFAAIELLTGDAPAAVVPKEALVLKESSAHVFAVVDRRIEERVVQPGVTQGDRVAVLRGVRVGDRLVRRPDAGLQNGQFVE